MNSEKKPNSVSILMCVFACSICLPAVQGQQAASAAHFGQGASSSGLTTGASAPVRGTGSGGGSNWAAGKGSFGLSAQPGGVWHDSGPSLGIGAVGVRSTTQPRTSVVDVLPPSGALPSEFSSSKPASVRGNAAAGTAHLSRSSSGRSSGGTAFGRRAMPKSSGISNAAVGSRRGLASLAGGAGSGETRPSSGLAARLAQQGLIKSPSLNGGVDTGLATKGSRQQP
jgi:hypothetical protein